MVVPTCNGMPLQRRKRAQWYAVTASETGLNGMPLQRRPPGRRSGIVENFPAPGARAPAAAARHRALLSSLFAIRDYRLTCGGGPGPGPRAIMTDRGTGASSGGREKQREHDARVVPRIAALLELGGYPAPPLAGTWTASVVSSWIASRPAAAEARISELAGRARHRRAHGRRPGGRAPGGRGAPGRRGSGARGPHTPFPLAAAADTCERRTVPRSGQPGHPRGERNRIGPHDPRGAGGGRRCGRGPGDGVVGLGVGGVTGVGGRGSGEACRARMGRDANARHAPTSFRRLERP